METRLPARSILKQSAPAAKDEVKEKVEKDRKNLNIALQHAYLIQHQKDVRAQILDSIQQLAESPSTPSPSTAEAKRFTTLIATFQPGDVDELIEERNADGKCGYVLCGNAPRSESLGASAVWKVGEKGMCFCSKRCTERLYFVKAQLSSTPAWERVPGQQAAVVLHEDERNESDLAASEYAQNVRRVEQELAMERNEKGGGAGSKVKAGKVMADRIVEKKDLVFRPLNSVEGAKISSTAIEGYEPRAWKDEKAKDGVEDVDEDEDD